tara:strand:- start:26 stop:637 length:612 start_codon:yes stop_codon:yes gene_type:complete
MTLAAGALGKWNLDASRHSRECLPPKDYMNYSYYEKWLAALTNLMVEKNLVTIEELEKFAKLSEKKASEPPLNENHEFDPRAWRAKDVESVIAAGGPSIRETNIKPLFKVGDIIKTVSQNPNKDTPGGHTRIPAYAMGKTGTIHSYVGTHVFPDQNAHNYGENPQPLYTVEFQSHELWTATCEDERDSVYLDLWEPYLVNFTT